MAKGPAPFDQGLFLMHLHKGKEYFDQNQLQKAREELEAAYHLRPQDEKILNLLGMAYFKLEMLPQAEEMYVTLASNNPDVYTLQSNLGLIRLKLDKLEIAEESLTRALELQPGNQKAHFYLGLLYEKWEKWDKALYHFEHAKADKMVEKVREKMEQEKKEKMGELLPFEVLEVIAEEEEIARDEITERLRLGQPIQEGIPTLPPAIPGFDSSATVWDEKTAMATSRMKTTDVHEAIAKVEARREDEKKEEGGAETLFEEEQPPALFEEEEVVAVVEEPPPPVLVEEEQPQPAVLPPASILPSEDEEELVEDSLPEPLDEPIEEGKVEEEEEPLWEKTQPKLIAPPPAAAEPVSAPVPDQTIGSEIEKTGPVSPPASGGFFMPEEIAADISTFLAESRVEEEVTEASDMDFIQEPPVLPPVEELALAPEPVEEIPVVETEERIPSPDEVENETRDMGEEPLFESETVEVIKPPSSYAGQELPAPEEDAFPQSEEEEAPVEYTQMMPPVSIPEMPAASVEPAPEPVPVPAAEPVEAPAAEIVAEPVVAPVAQIPATPVEPPRMETARDSYQAANLDQFSRDRFYVQPLIGADRFLLIDPHLLEIIVSDKILCRKGTISSFTGNLHFGHREHEQSGLVEVSGAGILFLADRRKEIFLISLNNDELLVEANHLLVAQSVLKVEPQLFEDSVTKRSFSMIRIIGRGTVALTCQTKPLTLNVHDGMPVNIPADALIAFSGNVKSQMLQDEELRNVLMTEDEGALFLRFTGNGDVVVEQGSLWGDRRAKK